MPPSNKLSDREQEVVKLLLEGKSNKLIASSLSISQRTVEFHLKNIYTKYEVSSRTELILKLGNATGMVKTEKPGDSTVSGGAEPGQSTVADNIELAENRDQLNLRMSWATSLREAVSSIGKEIKMTSYVNSTVRDEGNARTFQESILICLTKYAEFNGRASRSEFWWFALFVTLVAAALAYLGEIVTSVFLITMLLPFLAAGSRRLHDTGKSGWWQLFLLVPVAGIVLVGILWALPPASALPDDTFRA